MLNEGVPLEGSLGHLLGRELKDIAFSGAPDGLLEATCGYISSMLRSDAESVIETVLLPASGANGVGMLSISIRDEFRRNLAIAARDYSINLERHKQAPVTGDSAAQS